MQGYQFLFKHCFLSFVNHFNKEMTKATFLNIDNEFDTILHNLKSIHFSLLFIRRQNVQ